MKYLILLIFVYPIYSQHIIPTSLLLDIEGDEKSISECLINNSSFIHGMQWMNNPIYCSKLVMNYNTLMAHGGNSDNFENHITWLNDNYWTTNSSSDIDEVNAIHSLLKYETPQAIILEPILEFDNIVYSENGVVADFNLLDKSRLFVNV